MVNMNTQPSLCHYAPLIRLRHMALYKCVLIAGWPLTSHYQIPGLFQTFQVTIYGVSTLATVAIQNETHVVYH